MLVSLRLHHFVLIDSSSVPFEKGFNVLTGETGAGKTLLIQAIELLLGQKVGVDSIRKGEEKATIEATFDVENLPHFHPLLQEKGIDFDLTEYLIIKREIFRSSKNRVFVNGQMVPLSFLAEMGKFLFELVGQNSSHLLRTAETQREFLDSFAGLEKEVAIINVSYEEEKELEKTLETFKSESKQGERELERLKWERDEWEDFGFKEGEGDALFDEYKRLLQSEQLGEKLQVIQEGLSNPSSPLLPTLNQYRKELDKLSSSDDTLAQLAELLSAAIVNLQELSFKLSERISSFEQDPKRFEEVEKRLSILGSLKKKYRLEESEILPHIEALSAKIVTYEKLDGQITEIVKCLEQKKGENLALSTTLSQKRKAASPLLEKALKEELQELNLPNVEVEIRIEPKALGPSGSDGVTFFFAANKGEPLASLKEKSSGGEIARFLFALKLVLAEKDQIPTLIFDEIDSNVGGETATRVGEKLRRLGKSRQVLCITHFPQVARFANHHLQISKDEKDERTFTHIFPLDEKQKQGELLRMLGGSIPIELIN